MKVGFDLDGVLYNFGESVRLYLEHTGQGHLWKSGPTPEPFWNFYEDWGWTGKQFVEFCHAGADAGFIFCGETRPNAVETMNKVKAAGHEVIIITDRAFGATPEVSQENTFNWLDMNGFQYDSVTFSADKTRPRTDIFVEDKPENFVALWEAGIPCWLINRAWNQHIQTQYRIDDISEYPQKVEELSLGLVLVS